MNNKIPKELIERQEQQRQDTINCVRRAIEDLSSEGHKITIKLLIEYTGLSRSVFAKEHIKAVLVENGIGIKKDCSHKPKEDTCKEKLMAVINKQKTIIEQLKEENRELNAECELLRGRIFELMQK